MEKLWYGLIILIVVVVVLMVVVLIRLIINQRTSHNESLMMQHQLETLFKETTRSANDNLKTLRLEMSEAMHHFSQGISSHVNQNQQIQSEKFDRLNETMMASLEKVRASVDTNFTKIIQENNEKLEQMRMTVDEKLQASVAKRFNESFHLISERLDMVQQGLGEMQTLAIGVGDLKNVLTNVKSRGNLGEIQLKNILDNVLAPSQYKENVSVKNPNERVEFAILLPHKDKEGESLLLPIDSKFPMEDYRRLLDAYDNNEDIPRMQRAFERRVLRSAKDIFDKYINPPKTTDFAMMFVPTEGLYAEILRIDGLFDACVNDYKIIPVGPANCVAFLSSLQMGFRTLAIEKHSSEVWHLLTSIKKEFHQFSSVLSKTKKKLQEASNVIDQAETRTRVIERQLDDVETLEVE